MEGGKEGRKECKEGEREGGRGREGEAENEREK